MNFKRFHLIILIALVSGSACKRHETPNKIIDTLPVNTQQIVLPAEIAQQFFLLKRDSMGVIVRVINRFAITNSSFNELAGPDGSNNFTFVVSERHYGTANYTVQFRDTNNVALNIRVSTAAFQTAVISASGNSAQFNYTENLTLTLQNLSDATSQKNLLGSSTFNGSTYSMTFNFNYPGASATFDGLVNGTVQASGTGGTPPLPSTVVLQFSSDHAANGPITWEGQEGGLHYENNGSGYIVTNQVRILID